MRTKAVIFTCERHASAAEIAAEAASAHFDVLFAVDEGERNFITNRPVIWTSFRRNGNLNGIDAARGVANVLMSVMDNGYAVKIDSDTVIKDSSRLIGYDIAGFAQPKYPPTLLGCCYSISRRALEHSIACIDKAMDIGIVNFPEDTIITGYAQTLHRDDFNGNTIPVRHLGVWHPVQAPNIKCRIANFGMYRINGNWCHEQAVLAMREYLNS